MKKTKFKVITTSLITSSIAIATPILIYNSSVLVNNQKDELIQQEPIDELSKITNDFEYDFIDLDNYYVSYDTNTNEHQYLFLGAINKNLLSTDFKQLKSFLGLSYVDVQTNLPITYKGVNDNFKNYSLLKKVLNVGTMYVDNQYTDNDEFYKPFNNVQPNSLFNYKIDFENNSESLSYNWLDTNLINYCVLRNAHLKIKLEYIRTTYNNGLVNEDKLFIKINYDKSHYWSNNTNYPITILLSDHYN